MVYEYEKPKYIDSAIGLNNLSKVLNKSLSATKQSLRRYKKKSKSFIYLNEKKVIIVSEDDLK